MGDLLTPVVRVTDDDTRDELAECLHHLCDYARRQQCIVGDERNESRWDAAHRRIDALLTDWLAAPKRQKEP